MLNGKKIGIAISGSFCSMHYLWDILDQLKHQHADLYLFITPNVQTLDNKFNKADQLLEKLAMYSKHPLVLTIADAEKFGPTIPLDLMFVMPASANTIAKLSLGLCDNAVVMGCKATLRNSKPIVIALFTNDALGNSGVNIMKLLNTKGFYFVPFGQDDYRLKPNSMGANMDQALSTINYALKGEQIQPVIMGAYD